MENYMEVPTKAKVELACDPPIPLLGIKLKDLKLVLVHCSILHNSQVMEST
jgi:hypothetical protein